MSHKSADSALNCSWGWNTCNKCASGLNFIQKMGICGHSVWKCDFHGKELEETVCLIMCLKLTFFVLNSERELNHVNPGKLFEVYILKRRCWFVKWSKWQCFNSVEV